MQSMCSITELHPQAGVMLGNKSCQCITKETFLNQTLYFKKKKKTNAMSYGYNFDKGNWRIL